MGGGNILKPEDKKKYWKEVNSVMRIRVQASEVVLDTNGEVLEGENAL